MSLPVSYFDEMYRETDDPWGFRSRWYEARKRAVVLASLQSERYPSIFEPGCSIGTLTADLAGRADRILAMDVSSRALETAAASVPGHVELRQGGVPGDWPSGEFDLVVMSEVAYYLDTGGCEEVAALAVGSAAELVVVHWRHPVSDYPLGGDEVHALFGAAARRQGLEHLLSHVEPDFRVDSWCRDHRSVAVRAGLVGR
ncbi:MAG TPA: SAM-dependent methyltransferase [Acidimicrobiales bacterium]|nr:SAM-dependent methyltransferase [Acidimicrobiales bacterium]